MPELKRKKINQISESEQEFSLDEEEFLNNATESNSDNSSSDDASDLDNEIVHVDFDFFPPKEIDFHGLKTLLQQSFGDPSSTDIDFSKLADAIIEQNFLGTTVKTDGENGDPYAAITLLPMSKASGALEYFKAKIKSAEKKQSATMLAALEKASDKMLLLISERLINMPPQLSAPLYRLLLEDFDKMEKDGKLQKPQHILYMSKIWMEAAPSAEVKQNKKKKAAVSSEAFYFHPEDALLEQNADIVVDYKLPQQQVPDSRRVFSEVGMDPFRRLMIIPWAPFRQSIAMIETQFNE